MKAMTRCAPVIAGLVLCLGCRPADDPALNRPGQTTLTIGVAIPAATAATGMQQTARNITLEGLLNYGRDGRPVPFLAREWSTSDDGLTLRLRLAAGAVFHDGSSVTAAIVRDALLEGMPSLLGPAFEDVQEIRAVSSEELVIVLKRPSAFAIEALDVAITKPDAPTIGTGPFRLADGGVGEVEMRANPNYYLGKPAIDRIVFKSYPSVRSAWADLLRDRVDMLYEVGVDAMNSLQPSNKVRIFSYRRHYAYMAIFNPHRSGLRQAAVRRALNSAVNRERLIVDALGGRGAPATGPVWPSHWAIQPGAASFAFAPAEIGGAPLRLTCIFGNPDLERLALVLQRQLQSVGVELELQAVSGRSMLHRLEAADFDVVLTDAISGPSMARPYLFWHSKGPLNYGRFSSAAVDAALDAMRHASDDGAYRAAVTAFQQAIVEDPPALFLAWSERARAVNTRFDVASEPERDVWSSLRLWRPVGAPALASRR
jgi:peptide/nickel transport system substrate-binding protein